MTRTDRLFETLQILRDGRVHGAADLARRLSVSVRTVWRDMDTLRAGGVPVEGTRGRGYVLGPAVTLPPLTLDETELEALRLGLALVAEAADPEMQEAARTLARQIEVAHPGAGGAPAARWGVAAFPFAEAARGFTFMPQLRRAIREKRVLRLSHPDPDGQPDATTVRPLQMEYRGRLWSLTVWCEESNDFRVFRVDHITALTETGATFTDEPGRRFADHVERFAAGPDGN